MKAEALTFVGFARYLDEGTLDKYPDDEFMQDGDVVYNGPLVKTTLEEIIVNTF